MLRVDISEFESVNSQLAERLTRAGFDSADTLIDCSMDRLLNVQGVGPVKIKKLLKEASEQIERRIKTVELKKEETRKAALENEATDEPSVEDDEVSDE